MWRCVPQLGGDAPQQLGDAERFDQVVVRPCFQAADDIVLAAQATQQNHRKVEPLPTQVGAEPAPVPVRQADVEHGGGKAVAVLGH